jgi:hypothetical protein
MELVRIKSYNHALIMLLPLYCALIEGIMLALRTINKLLKKEKKSSPDQEEKVLIAKSQPL